jgi:2-amino-4-hydroxy-6-hydroxymethyldihydropteridine diphosphokinase
MARVKSEPVIAYVAMGSNLGDRQGTIIEAVRRLARYDGVKVLAVSNLVENPAVGGPAGQGPFLNGAMKVETTLGPRELLGKLLEVERGLGRVRKEKWGPRRIDLDLVLYGGMVIEEEGLVVPHPGMGEREFVLAPLAEIGAEARHPKTGKTVGEMLVALRGLTPPATA